ncbi:MAG TPA: 16S rRNA (guanine(527)-N(7))-methyltransferase RsmG [Dehalococcoidia bacterium]|nr:16S rRNA (guanine(527)-N(7))-methyltransferase RsmG [Dehalococcoidia bacterium]
MTYSCYDPAMPSHFAETARRLGVELDDEALRRFRLYRDRIVRSAAEFSLTTVRDPDGIEIRHFLEAIAFGVLLGQRGLLSNGARVLDIGSGAGLPGLPLKIAWPHLNVTLLEATGKKCRFLEQVVLELGLGEVEVVEARIEDAGRDAARRSSYDLVVARAVAPLPVLLEYALPLLKVGGRLAVNKGSAAEREIDESDRALHELGGVIEEALPFYPPEVMGQTLIVVRKVAETPERYPRRAGIPSKRPLA